jgi:hypothetical protein
MAETFNKPSARRRLSELLAEPHEWLLKDCLLLVHELALQVRTLHQNGGTHRAICAEQVSLDEEFRPQLGPPAGPRRFGGEDSDLELCPPQLALGEALEVPERIDAAAAVLQRNGRLLDPRSIDIYQLGTLLCRLVTGEPMMRYMYDPTIKARVPPVALTVLERALGEKADHPLEDCQQLIEALQASARQAPSLVVHHDGPANRRVQASAESGTQKAENRTPKAASGKREAPLALPSPHSALPSNELPLERLGHYRILRWIGGGGMGRIYQGYDESLDRHVAIKVLRPDLARDQACVCRFHAEATAVANLSHPNIVPVYYSGEDAGYHFFAMQLVDGESLSERLARQQRLPLEQALEIGEQCLAGLEAAHRQGLIHRDIKPANVLLERQTGRAMLVDFGLVRRIGQDAGLTTSGTFVGTLDYIAPEQARGQKVDGRADIYSLGALMYQLLSGRLPFEAETPEAMLFQHASEQPLPLREAAPELPQPVAGIVNRMIAKDPEDRYLSCAEVLADLRAFRKGRPVPATAAEDGTRTTSVLAAPEPVAEPQLLQGLATLADDRRWRLVGDRLAAIVGLRGPELVSRLRATAEQVCEAVAEHERRRRLLADLLPQARKVAADLSASIKSHAELLADAMEQGQGTPGGEEGQAKPAMKPNHEEILAVQKSQKEEQERQIAEIERQLSTVDATLVRLRSRYDALEARLQAAEALWPTLEGRRRVTRRRRVLRTATLGGVILAVAAVPLWMWLGPPAQNASRTHMALPPPAPPPSPFPARFPAEEMPPIPLELVDGMFDTSNVPRWEIQDDHLAMSMGGCEHPTMSKDTYQASSLVFGYKIKAEWHHFIRIDVDGREYSYSRGHWLNHATRIDDGKREIRREGIVPASDADQWCSLAVWLKEGAVGFYYKDRLQWWGNVEEAPKTQDGKHIVRVGFASHNNHIRVKDFFLECK